MRNILIIGIGLILIGGALHTLISVLFLTEFGANPLNPPTVQPGEEVIQGLPQPRIQVAPGQDMDELLATEQARLNTYEVIDEAQGQIRLPIEDAMQIVSEMDFPVTPEAFQTPFADESGFEPDALNLNPTPAQDLEIDPGAGLPQETAAPGGEGQAGQGAALFQSLGCSACHFQGSQTAPALENLAGETVTLEGGETVTADEVYIRESILHPQTQIVQGYQPIMPGFEGRVSEEELDAMVSYIFSLGGE
jgi:mono/diheme cytochrome c family protein